MQLQPSTSNLLTSFDAISRLANVYRHNGMTFDPGRKENVAEHSYALAALGCALAQEFNENLETPLDLGKVSQFAIVHDLTEAFMKHGDISVYASADLLGAKKAEEKAALKEIEEQTKSLPWIVETIERYEAQDSLEARFVYALDKIVVHMVVILNNQHHAKPTLERYLESETLAHGKIKKSFPQLLPYFDELCQMFKDKPHLFSDETSTNN
jgi:5'-deoxynucleotidase YfbR-like HD superfamily hydrolase